MILRGINEVPNDCSGSSSHRSVGKSKNNKISSIIGESMTMKGCFFFERRFSSRWSCRGRCSLRTIGDIGDRGSERRCDGATGLDSRAI